MREVVTSTDILLANSNHPYFLIMDWSNKIALLRISTECILTKRLESTFGYFGDQTPSESKSPVSRLAFGFIISGVPHFRNPYLTKVTNQLGSTLRRSRYLFDISRTFEITASVFHHYFKCLN
jgi:hypothetical protein